MPKDEITTISISSAVKEKGEKLSKDILGRKNLSGLITFLILKEDNERKTIDK